MNDGCLYSRVHSGPNLEFPYWCVTHKRACANLHLVDPAPRCGAENRNIESFPCLLDLGHEPPHDDRMGAKWSAPLSAAMKKGKN